MYHQEGYRSMNLMHQVVYPLVSPQAGCLQKEKSIPNVHNVIANCFFLRLSFSNQTVHLVIRRGHEGGSMRDVSHAHFESIFFNNNVFFSETFICIIAFYLFSPFPPYTFDTLLFNYHISTHREQRTTGQQCARHLHLLLHLNTFLQR